MIFDFSSCVLIGIWCMYQEGVEEYDDLQEYAEEETKNDAPAADGEKLAAIDFKALQEINGEVVAWIRCEALGLDYPVVQGEDNEYYLDHTFTGEEHSGGCIFMDCRNTPDFSDDNTILYGHNRKDGSMFGSFGMSLEGEVTVQVYTPQGLNTYQAVDNRIIGASEEPYYRTSLEKEQFAILSSAVSVHTGIPMHEGEKLLTLSTCNGNDQERHIILCRKTAPQEQAETAGAESAIEIITEPAPEPESTAPAVMEASE